MNNDEYEFLHVPDTAAYVRAGIDSGEFTVRTCVKAARIHAEPGIPGEKVVTVLKNLLIETGNTVGTDPETGVPDWIVTAPDGERYIVKDTAFRQKYIADPDEPGAFLPAGKPIDAVQIHENIRFIAPWGEEMFLLAGGFLMLDPGGIYGAAEAEFRKTYRFLDEEAPSEDEAGEPPGGPGAIRRHTPFTNLE